MNPDPTILKKLDDLIEANLDNPDFAINAVCQKLGVSRSQLHRMLIEETQLSTTLYIRKKRLEKAKILLSTTNLRISEITDAVGISSHANFSKYFVEEFNISPRDFKKRVEEQKNSVQKPKMKPNTCPNLRGFKSRLPLLPAILLTFLPLQRLISAKFTPLWRFLPL